MTTNGGNRIVLATAGRDPGSRAPAPGSLRLVQALVNTVSVEFGRDLLDSQARAAQWLAAAGLLSPGAGLTQPGLTQPAQRALVELREAIRGVLAIHTTRDDDQQAADRLTLALAPSRLAVTVDPAGHAHLASADHDPLARAIGAVAAAIAEAAAQGTWPRLKSCRGDHCGWAFYDRSPSTGSRWCSMQLCGTRAKMRAYRTRSQPAT